MSDGPVVHAPAGAVQGLELAHGRAFLGIPYAQAERFAPPRPTSWQGELRADRPAPVAPQPRRPLARFTHGDLPETDEQCLALNVWAPPAADRLPVLVWLHGGGFTIGWGSASLYDGARLATSAGVVVVTLNYRLGSLGWLCHPELADADGAPAGNWGLLDQLAALEWVRENIAAFGGDPARVTLAGQSAGALSAMDLLVSPRAQGLFQRTILQSPPLFDVAHDPELGGLWAEALSRRAGAPAFDPAALRGIGANALVELHEELLADPSFVRTRGGALPMLDPATVPASPAEMPGARPDVDVLIGSTADEATFFFRAARRPEPDETGLLEIVGHLPGIADAAETVAAYRRRSAERGAPVDSNSLLVRIATDAMVAGPTASWARARAAAGARVHRYRVDHPCPEGDLGAIHTVEVPLVFATYGDGDAGTRLAGDGPRSAAVSREMVREWGRFVRGEPVSWPQLTAAGEADVLAVFGGADEEPMRAQSVSEE